MTKVSIGVPVYNVGKYLRECLNSIINQTFTDFEVILVDDGSTDNSFTICQEYVAKDNRFKLIHQENKGLAGARNTCLKYMKGEYVTWVDSDDRVEANYLERLLEVQEETQADLVNGYNYGFKDGMIYYYDYTNISPNLEKFERTPKEQFLLTLSGNDVVFWGNLAKKKLYRGVYCAQGKNHEDNGTKFKLYFRANKIVILPEQLYGYRVEREGSIMADKLSSKTLEKKLKEYNDIFFNVENFVYFMEISQSKDVIDRVHLQYLSHMYNLRKSDLTGVNEEKFEQYTVNYMNRRKRYLE